MRIDGSKVYTTLFACLVVLASATYAQAADFTIGGTVSGLISGRSVTLLDNGANALTVTANGTFTFTTALATGAAYKVTVSVQPSGETCTVTAGSGTVVAANVTNVAVACKANDYSVGGTSSGLIAGRFATLLDNGGAALKVAKNGTFTFATKLASGTAYAVTISVQPVGETCSITSGTGTVVGSNVTSVGLTCTPNDYTIGGAVSGLISGRTVTLLDDAANSLAVTANGAFTFTTALASGTAYKVTVGTQPLGEVCTVTKGTGTLVSTNVTTVAVACKANTYSIGGTVSGLISGRSVTLLDNGAGALKVAANGAFTFATKLASGKTYDVTVSVQASGETCTVTNGSGPVVASNITSVAVACTPKSYTIGGTVSGLLSGRSVTVLDNGGNALPATANGKFTFTTALASGTTYAVTVGTQPSGETCTITNGSGTVVAANVINVLVACKANTYTIGGTVSGLSSGGSVTLLDNGADALAVTANGSFTFTTAVASGKAYKVTVSVQPTGETCTVTSGSGTVGSANVTNVAVACASAKTYTIGGTISGLNASTSVTLLNNGGNALTVGANGSFTFTTALASGKTYSVTVGTQPTGETCTVTNGSGTVGSANVTNVAVACAGAKTYTIGGTVSGLITGRSVTLLDNGGNSLTVTANGSFTFTTALAGGATYAVTVGTQPSGETCAITNGSGTVGSANVTNVAVACAANTYTIGGTVSGLISGRSVTLLDNGGNSLAVTANGSFTFTTAIASGATYAVTVGTQPSGETCSVTNGSGTVGSANVTNVAVACAASTYTIGGTVSGLISGRSVTLLDNGGNSLTVSANGSFTFTTALASGATYAVTVGTQPTGETCTITNGSGTVGSANVTNVTVACTANTYTIGGTVSGLSASTSVKLLDNGGNSLTVSANGAFTFTTAIASGSTYSVTVGTQPTGETCTVTNGSGTVGSANVTNVAVACATTKTFTIGGTVSGLNASTSVTLLDNGGNSLTVSANGSFTFTTAIASGSTYSVTVGTEPTGETCTVTNGSGTVGSANVTNVAVACSTSGGGGGAYWIPYSAAPIPTQTPTGSNGLFLIPSDKLASSPAPTFVTTDTTKLLGIGSLVAVSGGVATYSPQVMMYADTNSAGITSIFGITLAGTSSVPTPAQIGSLALPSGQEICGSASAETDVTKPDSLIVVIAVGTAEQCISTGSTYEVVHYTDSASTAPVVVSINTTEINGVYQNGKLVGLLVFDGTTSSLDLYKDDTFTSPTQEITGLSDAHYLSGVLDEATLSTTGIFESVTTTAAATELYRIDGSTLAATLIQDVTTGSFGTVAQDDNNLYYPVINTGASSTTISYEQVALTGGTPTLLYTTPAFVPDNSTAVTNYQLIGANDSVLVFEYSNEPKTGGVQDPTKATATLYTVPVGTTTTTPTTLATYPAGDTLIEVFLAPPSGVGPSGDVLFATVQNATGSISSPTITYSAVSRPLNGGSAPAPIANSIYAPLAVITAQLSYNVWQLTGITETDGFGWGGGTANLVDVGTLADTPFTTTGGGNYVLGAGFSGGLEALSSDNIAVGFFENEPAFASGAAPLQVIGAAADLTTTFLYPIVLTNTEITPY